MKELQQLIQRYVDYSVDNMDLDAMELFVKDVMTERIQAMSEQQFIDEVQDIAPELLNKQSELG